MTASTVSFLSWHVVSRASALPNYLNCMRAAAAQMDVELRDATGKTARKMNLPGYKGYTIPYRKKKHIGAVTGTAGHAGITAALEQVIKGGEFDESLVFAAGSEKLNRTFNDDVETDTLTSNLDTAQFQLKRMLAAHIEHAKTLKPARVEWRITRKIDSRFSFTGEMDILEEDGNIRDMKFGKRTYPYEPQLGMYSLLAQSEGITPNRLFVDSTKRTAKSKPQIPTEVIEYDRRTAEVAADRTADLIMTQITKFIETGDPWEFPANPNSMLCSKQWCPAWGTDFCDLGRPEKTTQSED